MTIGSEEMNAPESSEDADAPQSSVDPQRAMKVAWLLTNHALRLDVFRLLLRSEIPISAKDGSAALGVALENVAYSLRTLRDHDAATLVRTEPVRGSLQRFYRPNSEMAEHPIIKAILASAEAHP